MSESSKIMVLDARLETCPVPRLSEVWATHAGPVEVSMPLPGVLSAEEAAEVAGRLEQTAAKVRRLHLVPLGTPLVKRLPPEQEDRLKADLMSVLADGLLPTRLKNAAPATPAPADDRTSPPSGQPVRSGWYHKPGDQSANDRYVIGSVYPYPDAPTHVAYRTPAGEQKDEPLAAFLEWAAGAEYAGRSPAPPPFAPPVKPGLYVKPGGERRLVKKVGDGGRQQLVTWTDHRDGPSRSCPVAEFQAWAAHAHWVGAEVAAGGGPS